MDETFKVINESNYSDYKSFDSIVIESKTFDTKTIENIIPKVTTTDINNDNNKFNEMSISNVKKNNKIVDPHILIEDKGYKNEGFRNYEISFINMNEDKIIKSYRRFSNFDSFHKKLKEKYPYVIIPSLPEKNYATKIIHLSEDFYENRLQELNFYINYIYKHDILKNSNEFLKFLNDTQFDEKFYELNDINKHYPESDKCSNSSIGGQIYSYFSTFFKPVEYSRIPTKEEIYLNKQHSHFQFLYEKFLELKKAIKLYIFNVELSGEYSEELANNFLYLKEVNFESFSNKVLFTKINEILSEYKTLSNITKKDKMKNILEGLHNFLIVLKGLNEAFDRWFEFIKLYEKVDKAVFISKSYPKNFNLRLLSEEHQNVQDIKNNFFKYFTKEITQFSKTYKDIYYSTIEYFKALYCNINMLEMNTMKGIENFLQNNSS